MSLPFIVWRVVGWDERFETRGTLRQRGPKPKITFSADLNSDGYVSGREELFPMYVAAARDFTQPLFAYGPPRLVRLGVELLF